MSDIEKPTQPVVVADKQQPTLLQVALALSMLKNLVRMSTGDAAYLAIASAAKEVGVSEEEAMATLLPLVKRAGTIYPPGFM